jgi:hypothetical protein
MEAEGKAKEWGKKMKKRRTSLRNSIFLPPSFCHRCYYNVIEHQPSLRSLCSLRLIDLSRHEKHWAGWIGSCSMAAPEREKKFKKSLKRC